MKNCTNLSQWSTLLEVTAAVGDGETSELYDVTGCAAVTGWVAEAIGAWSDGAIHKYIALTFTTISGGVSIPVVPTSYPCTEAEWLGS